MIPNRQYFGRFAASPSRGKHRDDPCRLSLQPPPTRPAAPEAPSSASRASRPVLTPFAPAVAFALTLKVNHPGAQQAQVRVKLGERVALKFVNGTPMAHPMHLHGHSFQVVEVDGQAIKGALRDTVLLPGRSMSP